MSEIPLCFHGLGSVPDDILPQMMAEFAANGVTRLGFASTWCERLLDEAGYLGRILELYRRFGMVPAARTVHGGLGGI